MWPLFLLAFLALAVSLGLFGASSDSRSEIQLLAVPLVAFLLLSARILTIAVPRPVIAFGMVAAIIAMLGLGMQFGSRQAQMSLARLQGDGLEADTRIMRERINSALRGLAGQFELGGSARLRGSGEEIKSAGQALRALAASKEAFMLVWGNPRWLQVSFAKDAAFVLPGAGLIFWLERHNLELVQHVPIVGLSFRPPGDTAAFVASLYSALFIAKHAPQGELTVDFEMLLRYAADHQGLWSSAAHRALPYWMLGNYHLSRALENGYEPGEINCALDSFRHARGVLRVKDNHWLLSAVLNNQAIAELVKTAFEGGKKSRPAARKDLQLAVRVGAKPDHWKLPNQAAAIARFNLKSLKKLGLAKRGPRKLAGSHKSKSRAAKRSTKNQKKGKKRAR